MARTFPCQGRGRGFESRCPLIRFLFKTIMTTFIKTFADKTDTFTPMRAGPKENIAKKLEETSLEALKENHLAQFVLERISHITSTIASCAEAGLSGVESNEGVILALGGDKYREIAITNASGPSCLYYSQFWGRGHAADLLFIKNKGQQFVLTTSPEIPLPNDTIATNLDLLHNPAHQQLVIDLLDDTLLPLCRKIDKDMFSM